MPCRFCNNQNARSNPTTVAASNTDTPISSERCSDSSFWPEFATLPRNTSANSEANFSGCCSRCSRRA